MEINPTAKLQGSHYVNADGRLKIEGLDYVFVSVNEEIPCIEDPPTLKPLKKVKKFLTPLQEARNLGGFN